WSICKLTPVRHFHSDSVLARLFSHKFAPLAKNLWRGFYPITGIRTHSDNGMGMDMRSLSALPHLLRITERIMHRKDVAVSFELSGQKIPNSAFESLNIGASFGRHDDMHHIP